MISCFELWINDYTTILRLVSTGTRNYHTACYRLSNYFLASETVDDEGKPWTIRPLWRPSHLVLRVFHDMLYGPWLTVVDIKAQPRSHRQVVPRNFSLTWVLASRYERTLQPRTIGVMKDGVEEMHRILRVIDAGKRLFAGTRMS